MPCRPPAPTLAPSSAVPQPAKRPASLTGPVAERHSLFSGPPALRERILGIGSRANELCFEIGWIEIKIAEKLAVALAREDRSHEVRRSRRRTRALFVGGVEPGDEPSSSSTAEMASTGCGYGQTASDSRCSTTLQG